MPRDLRRGVAGGYEVVQVLCALCIPLSLVHAEGRGSYRRIVPEESVAAAGDVERNTRLGIPVAELQHGALLIQVAVLVLSHSENLFVVIGFKARGYLVIRAALVGLEFTAGDTQGDAVAVYAVAVAPVFLGEHFAALIPEAEPALVVELHREFSIGEEEIGAGLVILRVFLPLVPGAVVSISSLRIVQLWETGSVRAL